MTAHEVLAYVADDRPVPGRHLVLVAHPDDEVISASAAISCLKDVVVLQLTDDSADRETERTTAYQAMDWSMSVERGGVPFRTAHLMAMGFCHWVVSFLENIDILWTHPYEGGHLDHDTAAWIGQTVGPHCLRLEFASYHATATGQTFGDFWPEAQSPSVTVQLTGERLARKQAALAAYASQAHILRKFPHPEREVYRQAPVYDFSKPAPPPRSRWDVKDYQPSTETWRQIIGQVAA